jgi:hypothetical protein
MQKEVTVTLFKLLFQYFSSETEENREEPQGQSVSRPIFELDTSKIQVR